MDCCFLSPSPWCDVPVQMFFFLFLIDVDANIFLSSICNWPMMIQLWVNIFNGLVVCLLFHRHGQYLVQRHFDAIASRWKPVVDPYYEITERYCSLALVSHLAWRRTLTTVLWQSWKKELCWVLLKNVGCCENLCTRAKIKSDLLKEDRTISNVWRKNDQPPVVDRTRPHVSVTSRNHTDKKHSFLSIW